MQRGETNLGWRVRLRRVTDGVLGLGTLISAAALVVTVLIQVVSRYALPQAPSWTEELSRYLFIYMVGFGAALGIPRQGYVGFDALIRSLPERVQDVWFRGIAVAMAGFMAIVLWHAFSFVELGRLQTSATLKLPMNWVHFSIVILALFSTLYAVLVALDGPDDDIEDEEVAQ